jgi:hypothetical protein
MDSVLAIRIHNGSLPQWTDGEYGFQKFIPFSDIGKANLTAENTGYSAYIDCRTIPESEYKLTMVKSVDPAVPLVSLDISANDRDCQISQKFSMLRGSVAVNPWATVGCSLTAKKSRLSIAAARYAEGSDSPTNISLISCIPSYWTTPGTLTVATGLSHAPLIQTFSPNNSHASQFASSYWKVFESELQYLVGFDPTAHVSGNEFGKYTYAIAIQNLASTSGRAY